MSDQQAQELTPAEREREARAFEELWHASLYGDEEQPQRGWAESIFHRGFLAARSPEQVERPDVQRQDSAHDADEAAYKERLWAKARECGVLSDPADERAAFRAAFERLPIGWFPKRRDRLAALAMWKAAREFSFKFYADAMLGPARLPERPEEKVWLEVTDADREKGEAWATRLGVPLSVTKVWKTEGTGYLLDAEGRVLLKIDLAALPERPGEPADDARCRCGHTAHWHAAVVYEGESGEGPLEVPQGAGGCEERSEDGSPCGCEQFEARLPERPDERQRAALLRILDEQDTEWATDPASMDQRFVANQYAGKLERIFAVARAAVASRPADEETTEANERANLSRALGLAQAIAQARPYPVEMDGVRGVAAEIASILEAALAARPSVTEEKP